jgi:hypothetical protein
MPDTVLNVGYLMSALQQPQEEGHVTVPTAQMRKLRPREVTLGLHNVSGWLNLD